MTSSSLSKDSIGTIRKTATGNHCKTLSAIQLSDLKLWRFWAIIAVDKTSSSTSRDYIGNIRKSVCENYCKILSAIKRSDQKLWPFSVVIPVWRDKSCSSTRRDSIGNTRKMASKTTVKLWARSNGQIKSYGPLQLLFQYGATRPPPQRVGIP